jgi:hypothetical protein
MQTAYVPFTGAVVVGQLEYNGKNLFKPAEAKAEDGGSIPTLCANSRAELATLAPGADVISTVSSQQGVTCKCMPSINTALAALTTGTESIITCIANVGYIGGSCSTLLCAVTLAC